MILLIVLLVLLGFFCGDNIMSDVVNSSSKKSASNTSKPVTSSNAKKNKLSKNAAEAVVLPNILSKYLKERNYSVVGIRG